MSDTPKTDAMMTALLWRTGETLQADVEFADFARQLERENAELRKALRRARPYVCWTDDEGRIPEDYPEVAALIRRDAKLIDTLLAKEAKP